ISKIATPSEANQGVTLLWWRQGDGAFEAVYHVPTVQADNSAWTLAAFSPSGRRVALQSIPGTNAGQAVQPGITVYDLDAGKATLTLPEYRLATWMNDDDLLAIEAQRETRLTRINVASGQKTIAGSVDAAAYSSDGKYFAQVEWSPNHVDSSVTIRKWLNGEMVAQIQGESALVHDHAWSSDGLWLATLGNTSTLRIWPVAASGR
ncbi:MAG TPA: hypothetical protein VGK81_07085, partial [Anaerolineae bacterium]